ncbi:MAG: hypothetical protein IT221_12445 [Fluviicola sp.]|nr:hypothetical protein [Fluviicola sp.]
MKSILFLAVIVLSLGACKNPKNATTENTVLSIKHGTSFGHCRGYCTKEKIYTPTSCESIELSRDSEREPARNSLSNFTQAEFNALVATIDFEKWNALEERIGCPDCADGGAEYIEITTTNGTKRVTFEYGANVEPIQALINKLRNHKETLEKSKLEKSNMDVDK